MFRKRQCRTSLNVELQIYIDGIGLFTKRISARMRLEEGDPITIGRVWIGDVTGVRHSLEGSTMVTIITLTSRYAEEYDGDGNGEIGREPIIAAIRADGWQLTEAP